MRLVLVELGSEPRAHYLPITSSPNDAEWSWEGEEVWSHDLYIHSQSEESATLLTPVWEHISNFSYLPSPLSRLFLATFDFLPTRILLNADSSLWIFSLAVFWFFYTSSLSKLPHCSSLQTLYHNHYWQTIADIQTVLTMHKSCTDVYKDYSHPRWIQWCTAQSPTNEALWLQLPGVLSVDVLSCKTLQWANSLERAILSLPQVAASND